jgi:hypothetical protein
MCLKKQLVAYKKFLENRLLEKQRGFFVEYIKTNPKVYVTQTISCTPEILRAIADDMEAVAIPDREVIAQITNDIALVYKKPFVSNEYSTAVSRESEPGVNH